MMFMATKTVSEQITLQDIQFKDTMITIVGDTPLITKAFGLKAEQEIKELQMKKAKKVREARNPWEDFIESFHWLTPKPTEYTEEAFNKALAEGAKFGFPAAGVKASAVSAAYRMKLSKDKVSLQGLFNIPQEFVEIEGVPEFRQDHVRIPKTGAADLTFRGEFKKWKATFPLRYVEGVYSLEQIINFINLGGFAVGIGEWRPEKSGNFGTFHVEMSSK